MGLITGKNRSNHRPGTTGIPFTVPAEREQSEDVTSRKERQHYLKNYLSAITKTYCHSLGYGFLTWERLGAPGAQAEVRYNAIASDGKNPIKLPFTDEMHRNVAAAEAWVLTGKGEQPKMPGESKTGNTQPLPAITKIAVSNRQLHR